MNIGSIIYLLVGLLFTWYLENFLYRNTGVKYSFGNRIELIVLWPLSFLSWFKYWITFFYRELVLEK